MFDRFVVIYFHTDNLCDVCRLLVTFQIKMQLPLNLLMMYSSMVGFVKIKIRLCIKQINKLNSIDFDILVHKMKMRMMAHDRVVHYGGANIPPPQNYLCPFHGFV